MLARIRNFFGNGAANLIVFGVVAVALGSCATKKQTALVSDPAAGPESALPWNQQQKWEGQGQFGGMAERMGAGARR